MDLLLIDIPASEIYNINIQYIVQFLTVMFLVSFSLLSLFYYVYIEKLRSISYMVGLCIALIFQQVAISLYAIKDQPRLLDRLLFQNHLSLLVGGVFLFLAIITIFKYNNIFVNTLSFSLFLSALIFARFTEVGWLFVYMYITLVFILLLYLILKREKSTRATNHWFEVFMVIYFLGVTLDFFVFNGHKLSVQWIGINLVLLYFVVFFLKRYMIIVEEKEELYEKLVVDEFTGLHTKAYFLEALENLYHGYLILFDINKFKSVNDEFGHLKGDEVLLSLCKSLKRHEKNSHLISRIGGDEFLIYLPEITIDYAKEFANLIIDEFKYTVNTMGLESIEGLGLSVGVTHVDARSRLVLFEDADKAMYVAKSRGNNLIVCSSEEVGLNE